MSNHNNIFVDYIQFHNQIDWQEIEDNKKQYLDEREKIFKPDCPIEEKKKLIFILAHLGTLESVAVLEKYLKNPDQELRQWAETAFDECKAFLKSDVLQDDFASVTSGAGKLEGKLRFYFVLYSAQKKNFTDDEKKFIVSTVQQSADFLRFVIEKIEINQKYCLTTALHTLEQAPAELIEEIIDRCNLVNNLIADNFFVINTHKPTEKEIFNAGN